VGELTAQRLFVLRAPRPLEVPPLDVGLAQRRLAVGRSVVEKLADRSLGLSVSSGLSSGVPSSSTWEPLSVAPRITLKRGGRLVVLVCSAMCGPPKSGVPTLGPHIHRSV